MYTLKNKSCIPETAGISNIYSKNKKTSAEVFKLWTNFANKGYKGFISKAVLTSLSTKALKWV